MKKLFFLIPFLLFGGFGCNSNDKENSLSLDYEYFEERFIKWNELFEQKDEDYFTYIFSYTCGHCYEIKDDVLAFAYSNNNFYFVEFDKDIKVIDSSTIVIGKDNVDEIGIVGTPTLFLIRDHKIENDFIGSKQILEAIKNNT